MSREEEPMERRLRELSPAPLDRTVTQRLRRQLAEGRVCSRRRTSEARWGLVAIGVAGLAACLALLWTGLLPSETDEPEEAEGKALAGAAAEVPPFGEGLLRGYRPVRRYNELLRVEESPVFYVDGGLPAKEIYISYLDTVIMENQDGSASLKVAAPREVVRVIPVIAD